MISRKPAFPFAALFSAFHDFFLWWREEMRTFWPVSRASPTGPRVVISKAGFSLDGSPTRPIDELGQDLLALGLSKELGRIPVTLVLDEDQFLKRVISDRRLPHSRLERAAELDVITRTPFTLAEIRIVVSPQQKDGAVFYILKNGIVEDIAGQLTIASLKIDRLLFGSGATGAAVPVKTAGLPTRRRLPLWQAMAVLTVLLWTFGLVHIEQKSSQASSVLSAEIEEATKNAHSARQEYDRYSARIEKLRALDARQTESASVIAFWSELTRVVPDTAFLTDFSLQDGVAEITGFGQQPAALISAIETSPAFRQARFTSPVVRIPGFQAEHFALSFQSEGG
ncbi:PilN domain-containing protein [Pararhizobium gei]|uniref:PilN domain-containing protein n=1 Tax=Pararhizobium gei TaxID=1395951 RepID=UPI0023DAA9BF|nr:PilN domain-containing protein [Rhizobium gei]